MHKDIVVVGAGISGIAAGYNLQKSCPDKSFVIYAVSIVVSSGSFAYSSSTDSSPILPHPQPEVFIGPGDIPDGGITAIDFGSTVAIV